MHIDVITLFPDMLSAVTAYGVTGRAFKAGTLSLSTINPREFADNPHGNIDDKPYGGGPGMVMQAKPLRAAIQFAKAQRPQGHVIYLSPQGTPLTQTKAHALSRYEHLILVAGRYEGIDQRIIDHDIDEEISLGDFVLSGGELAACCLLDAVIRLIPGVLGDEGSTEVESFMDGLLDHPHYTRPEVLDGQAVPNVLISGDHAAIARWREAARLLATQLKRPDLLKNRSLTQKQQALLQEALQVVGLVDKLGPSERSEK